MYTVVQMETYQDKKMSNISIKIQILIKTTHKIYTKIVKMFV